MKAEQKPNPLWPSVLVMGVFFVLAGFTYFFLTQATPEFYHLGIYQALFIAMGLSFFLALPTIILAVLLSLLRKKLRLPQWVCGRLFMGLGACAVVVALLLGLLHSRPKDRLMRLTSGAAADAGNVQVAGFNAFLAHRWLYAFDATEAGIATMVSELGLGHHEGYDLRSSLERDTLLLEGDPALMENVPNGHSTQTYSKMLLSDQASSWMVLVYSDKTKRAWLFAGYQN